jgi:hypothetical protein
MINDIPALIEYLSSFMTLQPGDVILTGTPDGVVNVNVGDEVVTRSTASAASSTPSSATQLRTIGLQPHAHPAPDQRPPVDSRDTSRPSTRPPRRCWPRWPPAAPPRCNAAVAAAKAAFPAWAGRPATERAALMRKLGDLITRTCPRSRAPRRRTPAR